MKGYWWVRLPETVCYFRRLGLESRRQQSLQSDPWVLNNWTFDHPNPNPQRQISIRFVPGFSLADMHVHNMAERILEDLNELHKIRELRKNRVKEIRKKREEEKKKVRRKKKKMESRKS